MNTVSIYQYEANNREPGIGNRESGTSSLFLIWACYTNDSKVLIGNKEPVPGSFFNYNLVDTSFWFCLFHQHVRH